MSATVTRLEQLLSQLCDATGYRLVRTQTNCDECLASRAEVRSYWEGLDRMSGFQYYVMLLLGGPSGRPPLVLPTYTYEIKPPCTVN